MVPDALSLIGLAGNIVQFLDFGFKLVSKGHEIYRSSEKVSIQHFELTSTTNDLRLVTDQSAKGLSFSQPDVYPIEDEEPLIKLGKTCSEVANKLLVLLDAIRVVSTDGKYRNGGVSGRRSTRFGPMIKSEASSKDWSLSEDNWIHIH